VCLGPRTLRLDRSRTPQVKATPENGDGEERTVRVSLSKLCIVKPKFVIPDYSHHFSVRLFPCLLQRNTEFGYSRKDVILIGVGLIGFGYVLYYGLQAGGMDAGMAGNWVQLIIFLGICVGWVGSYLWRVANKQMTYVKQLEDYEEAVMRKRLEEMPETELENLYDQINKEKESKK
jgi:hypothetical protein